MDVVPRQDLEQGKTHEERLACARRIAELCLARHGDQVAAIGIYGSTCVGSDLPYSDLDMTILTRVDLDGETRCYTYDGLTIQLDYQTIEDTIRSEIGGGMLGELPRAPRSGRGGCRPAGEVSAPDR